MLLRTLECYKEVERFPLHTSDFLFIIHYRISHVIGPSSSTLVESEDEKNSIFMKRKRFFAPSQKNNNIGDKTFNRRKKTLEET